MEAEAQLEAEAERQIRPDTNPKSEREKDSREEGLSEKTGDTAPEGIYPESDWEAIVEAVLFTMGNSVELRQLGIAIGQSERIARKVVENLQKRYEFENRGMQIIELDNAFQMSTKACFYENLIRVAAAPKKHVLTDVVLETLSIIAYRQPVTKMEISKIRGVSSDHAVNRLVEYGLVGEVGRLDAPGRPVLFATTEEFLRRFGISSMIDLPSMNPEQEEEILQEVEEELQMKLEGQGEIAEDFKMVQASGEEESDLAVQREDKAGDLRVLP
ncbi:MAG: SMC-Scp complex subunit ScpB [Lachnospiraceae bacterium]|nr:SMC-Scp complex subunit ScpB [Lachnospiraceae bacterium]